MLPEILRFENRKGSAGGSFGFGSKHFFYEAVDYRCPKKGEHYVSGAPGHEYCYIAPNDLSSEYLILRKTDEAVKESKWQRVKT